MSQEEQAKGKIEKIERVERIDQSIKPIENVYDETTANLEASKARFDVAMDKASSRYAESIPLDKTFAVDATTNTQGTKLSPLQEANQNYQKITRTEPATPENIVNQSNTLSREIESIKQKLSDPNVSLGSAAQKTLLADKLTHIHSGLTTALSKTGVELSATEAPQQANPSQSAVKFLRMLGDSQDQLMQLSAEIGRINATGQKLNPEQLLAIQIKLGFVQQQLEFFSNVLNKALESTKTIMNIQV